MKKQLVMIISALLLLSAVVIPAVGVSQSSAVPREESPFEDEPLWDANVSEEPLVIIGVEDDDVFAMDENSIYFIEKGGDIRWSRGFNETIQLRRTGRSVGIDEYIMTLSEGDDRELTLHRIDLGDGSSIWEKPVENRLILTRYLISENNSVYILCDELMIKISEDGEELWRREIEGDYRFPFRSRLDKDGNLYGIRSGSYVEGKIICISPQGGLRWEEEIDHTINPHISSDFSRDKIYMFDNNTMHRLDAEEGVVWSQNTTYMENIFRFEVLDDRVILLAHRMYENSTLVGMSKEGEALWNTTVNTEFDYIPGMVVGENRRIYLIKYNMTYNLLSIYNTMAFDLDGELLWEHDFEDDVVSTSYISESGVIYYSTSEGEIYAYQGKPLETDSHFLHDHFWVLAVIIIAVIIVSIIALILKGGRNSPDTYDKERPIIGEERYPNPHGWDDGSGSEWSSFESMYDEDPDSEDDSRLI